MTWLLNLYAKNTFARHIVIFAAAFLILEYGVMASDVLKSHLHNESAQAAVGAAIAWALRWSQTQVELLIVRLKSK